jgi:hypothetical protein
VRGVCDDEYADYAAPCTLILVIKELAERYGIDLIQMMGYCVNEDKGKFEMVFQIKSPPSPSHL